MQLEEFAIEAARHRSETLNRKTLSHGRARGLAKSTIHMQKLKSLLYIYKVYIRKQNQNNRICSHAPIFRINFDAAAIRQRILFHDLLIAKIAAAAKLATQKFDERILHTCCRTLGTSVCVCVCVTKFFKYFFFYFGEYGQ